MRKDMPWNHCPNERRNDLINDKEHFRQKKASKDKVGHCIVIKGQLTKKKRHLNMYAQNYRALKNCIITTDKTQGKIDKYTIIVGDFNIPSLIIDWRPR